MSSRKKKTSLNVTIQGTKPADRILFSIQEEDTNSQVPSQQVISVNDATQSNSMDTYRPSTSKYDGATSIKSTKSPTGAIKRRALETPTDAVRPKTIRSIDISTDVEAVPASGTVICRDDMEWKRRYMTLEYKFKEQNEEFNKQRLEDQRKNEDLMHELEAKDMEISKLKLSLNAAEEINRKHALMESEMPIKTENVNYNEQIQSKETKNNSFQRLQEEDVMNEKFQPSLRAKDLTISFLRETLNTTRQQLLNTKDIENENDKLKQEVKSNLQRMTDLLESLKATETKLKSETEKADEQIKKNKELQFKNEKLTSLFDAKGKEILALRQTNSTLEADLKAEKINIAEQRKANQQLRHENETVQKMTEGLSRNSKVVNDEMERVKRLYNLSVSDLKAEQTRTKQLKLEIEAKKIELKILREKLQKFKLELDINSKDQRRIIENVINL